MSLLLLKSLSLGLEGGESSAGSTSASFAEVTRSVSLVLESGTGGTDSLLGQHGQNSGNSFSNTLKLTCLMVKTKLTRI